MSHLTYVMRVVHNDISGERSEDYMLVPLAARDHDEPFWAWPSGFSAPTQYQERVVQVVDDGTLKTTRLYYVDERSEFRLVTSLYSAGPAAVGSILEVIRAPRAGVDYEYRLHLTGTTRHGMLVPHATRPVPNSDKLWGYI